MRHLQGKSPKRFSTKSAHDRTRAPKKINNSFELYIFVIKRQTFPPKTQDAIKIELDCGCVRGHGDRYKREIALETQVSYLEPLVATYFTDFVTIFFLHLSAGVKWRFLLT